MYCTLNYVETVQYSDPNAIHHEWNANSINDPNRSGTGHQPMYFDQYISVYQRWLVYASTVKMEIVNLSAGSLGVVMIPASILTPINDIGKLQEQNYSRSILVANFGDNKGRLSLSMTTRKIRGETVSDDDFSGSLQNPPSRQWFWITTLQNADPTVPVLATIKYSFTYRVRFFKRFPVIQS